MSIKIKGQYMNRSTFRTIKYMNGSIFSKARYMNWVGFEILARTPVPHLPQVTPRESDWSSQGAPWLANGQWFLLADSQDADQTA